MLWNELPDELDTAAIPMVISAVRGNVPDKAAATLACFNVAGYAAKQAGLGVNKVGAFKCEPCDDEECCKALQSLCNDKVGATAVPWGPLALKLLQVLLGLLA